MGHNDKARVSPGPDTPQRPSTVKTWNGVQRHATNPTTTLIGSTRHLVGSPDGSVRAKAGVARTGRSDPDR